jgi:E3 ubiquitin-protein ligase HERC1
LLWKRILQEPITVEDIEAIDIRSFTIINEMEKNIEQIQPFDMDQDIESVLSSIMSELRFDVVSSSGQTYELVPGGTEIPITVANFKQYCSCYRQYRLNEFNRQIDLIRQGLLTIIPWYYLNLLTAKDLEEAVCGKGQIDIELLKRNTAYGGDYGPDSPVIQRFWTVLNDKFTDEQKKLFLVFVWGRSTLPNCDEDFQYKFTINPLDVAEDNVDQTLPRKKKNSFIQR